MNSVVPRPKRDPGENFRRYHHGNNPPTPGCVAAVCREELTRMGQAFGKFGCEGLGGPVDREAFVRKWVRP